MDGPIRSSSIVVLLCGMTSPAHYMIIAIDESSIHQQDGKGVIVLVSNSSFANLIPQGRYIV